MSEFYGLVIWCDDCDTKPFKCPNAHLGAEQARLSGWSRRTNSGGMRRWRCPACTKAAAQEARVAEFAATLSDQEAAELTEAGK